MLKQIINGAEKFYTDVHKKENKLIQELLDLSEGLSILKIQLNSPSEFNFQIPDTVFKL